MIHLSLPQLTSALPLIPLVPMGPQEATGHLCPLEGALPAPQTSKILTWPKPPHFSWPPLSQEKTDTVARRSCSQTPFFFPFNPIESVCLGPDNTLLKIQICWTPLFPGRVCHLLEPAMMAWSCPSTRFTSITGRNLRPCHTRDLMHAGGEPHLVTGFFGSPRWTTA